ncbi:membrane protein [Caballeronia turbans]|jgi:cytochrome c oxidase assembly factor CtaG|uniref:cytochrome c oxidase assembly protein n=1 Tax=unclassified Caballeronia TaxID=2646786 RepID=UPI00074C10CC|nr:MULTISPECIES: cytochrome c oxidase assembly protein [unclassified Caballeronia]SAL22329.1 membrane protein [Caballeronia turbans]
MATVRLLKRALPCALAACADVHAHGVTTDASPLAWTFEPWVVGVLVLSAALYIAGYLRLRTRGAQGRSQRTGRLLAFLAGWLTLVGALVSPLHALSDWLFSAHMLQHELLMLVAAPLLVIGRPLAVWLWAFPANARTRIGVATRSRWIRHPWRLLTLPAVAWTLHAAALWCWHAPRFFEAALARPGIHTLQHASFLASALLFWWSVFGRASEAHGAPNAHAMLSLFTTMVHTGALGALLTLAPGVWYPSCIETTLALGFDPLQDQQLGGLVMWVPGGLAYLVGALLVGARWLARRPPRIGSGAR